MNRYRYGIGLVLASVLIVALGSSQAEERRFSSEVNCASPAAPVSLLATARFFAGHLVRSGSPPHRPGRRSPVCKNDS
jgi:hypothetical protein